MNEREITVEVREKTERRQGEKDREQEEIKR
jgi:hypothetical protein